MTTERTEHAERKENTAREETLALLRARIEALELTSAFQERTIGELDEVVQAFAQRVEQLERALERVRDDMEAPSVGPQSDPPPHSTPGSASRGPSW